jgi:long-chain fatty acid transport protein
MACLSLMLILGFAENASATNDGPATYDARSVGMGGTGVAYIDNGAASYHNPASLEGIHEFAATGVVTPFGPQLTTPVAGPQTEVASTRTFFPLFLLGAGYRVADPVVIGVTADAAGGLGATYEDVAAVGGANLELGVAVLEASPAVSYAVADGFSIGLAYRISYMFESVDTPSPMGMGTMKTSLSGFSFLGMQAGLLYKPIDELRLGLNYRSKVTAKLDGDTTSATPMGELSLDTRSKFSTPHKITLGGAYEIDKTWLLALDAKYVFYSEANKELVTTVTLPDGTEQSNVQPFDWKDVIGVSAGIEYKVVPTVGLRIGYSFSTSATPEETANIFVTPPGLVHGFHLGAGLDLESWAVDVGGAYAFVGSDVTNSTQGAPGRYDFDVVILSLAGTYRF